MDPSSSSHGVITSEDLNKWRSYMNAFPLPPHKIPLGGIPLTDVSDEALLTTPPQLIAHIQRTTSQKGLQTISPRQAPFTCLMVRKNPNQYALGDHEVGSIADYDEDWPTLDPEDFYDLLPDEPMPPRQAKTTESAKTKTISLAKGDELMADPVLSCLIKGRAVIDILRRDDVMGGAEEMADLVAGAWGIPVTSLMELDGFNLGIEVSLQRHAMKTDEVFPTVYAPTHVERSVSMGVSDLDKSVLLPDMAIDWRRMRTFCEFVFITACNVEEIPLKLARSHNRPGTKGLSHSRANMIVFAPAPAVAWTYTAETFSLMPLPTRPYRERPGIPPDVRDALQLYVRTVKPVSAVLAKVGKVPTWKSSSVNVPPSTGETLSSGYARVMGTIDTGRARGRTPSSTVRGIVYSILESATPSVKMRMSRYLQIAPTECKIHLGVETVPDPVVKALADRFLALGTHMRERIRKEAERKGETIDDWWVNISAQAPYEFSQEEESPSAWARVAMWLAFKAPTEKWGKLKHAIKMSAQRTAIVKGTGGVSLPAIKGSTERLIAAVQHGLKGISRAYAGHYAGVADVGYAISEVAMANGDDRLGNALKEAAHLWVLRARALRALNACAIAHDEKTPSSNHLRVSSKPVDILLKPAPYMPISAWKKHIAEADHIPNSVKRMVALAGKGETSDIEFNPGVTRKSSLFEDMTRPIAIAKESVLTKYVREPHLLGLALEKAWLDLEADTREIAALMRAEVEPRKITRTKSATKIASVQLAEPTIEEFIAAQAAEGSRGDGRTSFWDLYSQMTPDDADGLDERISRLPPDMAESLWEGAFKDWGEIYAAIEDIESLTASAVVGPKESVR